MQKKTSLKTKFSQFNDKNFYFSNGITSLPLSHPYLKELVEYKKKMGQEIERYFWNKKETLLDIENKAQQQNERLALYYQILMSAPNYLNEIFWISKIPPSSEREKNISAWFQKYVDFNYPQTIDELNIHLTFFKRKRQVDNDTDIVMGENNTFDKLIVMDNVLGRADKSDNFANFLTMSRKFNSTFVYVFHTMYPARSNWQMILSQTKNFNVFLGSLQTSSVIKVLSSYRNRYTYK